jgi:CheY-like chemotaxis protein
MNRSGTTIVIVDDDRELTASLEQVLTAEGYEVLTAPDGSKGMALIERCRPDLVILDVMMEHTTEGFEVSRHLRAHPELRDTPVLLVTGIRRELNLPFEFETDDTFLPVTRVLEKPVGPKELISAVGEALAATQRTTHAQGEETMEKAKTALIVDDNVEFAEATGELLSANGYTVTTTDNGANGYTKAVEVKPDLILLDVMMENAGAGLDTVRKLKGDESTAAIPVFLVTGIRKPELLLDSYAPGEAFPNVRKVFEKPVDPAKLVAALAEVG